jgi:hypothetical protein
MVAEAGRLESGMHFHWPVVVLAAEPLNYEHCQLK